MRNFALASLLRSMLLTPTPFLFSKLSLWTHVTWQNPG
jgi:hypothetical protein